MAGLVPPVAVSPFTPGSVWTGAVIALVLATLSGLPLIQAGGMPLLLLGVASLLAAVCLLIFGAVLFVTRNKTPSLQG